MNGSARRTALVTGGAKGIGRSIAEAIAKSGWNLVVCGRDREALSLFAADTEKETGAEVRWVHADLSEEGAACRLLREAAVGADLPDALVCNAGDYGVLGPLAEADMGAWKKSFDLNFFAVAELVQEYVKLSRSTSSKARRKILVVGGSGLGGSRVWPGISAYACAKAALYRLVEVVHEEVSGLGIDINCVAPGAVKTGITDQAVAAGASAIGALHRASLGVQAGGGDSPALVGDAVVALLQPSADGLSGRLISAKWDRDRLNDAAEVIGDADLLRLRRIDNELFGRMR